MNYKKSVLAFGVMVFAAIAALGAMHHDVAYADNGTPTAAQIKSAQIKWVNRSEIDVTIGGQVYKFMDKAFNDSDHEYAIQNYPCYGNINVKDIDNHPEQVKFDMDNYQTAASTKCSNVDGANGDTYSATSTSNSKLLLYRQDADTIVRLEDSKGDWTFKKSAQVNADGSTIFLRSKEDGKSCQDRLVVSADGTTVTPWILTADASNDISSAQKSQIGLPSNEQCAAYTAAYGGSGNNPGDSNTGGLGEFSEIALPLGTPENASGGTTALPPGTGSGGAAGGGGDTTSCESNGGVLAWILCPVYNYTASAAKWMLENLIVPMLKVNPICANSKGCSNSDNTIYAVWSNFRTYGDIFLVIALLVVVFGEAIGGGMIDAYTAKKILPRLLAAAILINLSIYIVAFLVDVFNVLGGGIWDVITAPVAKAGALKIDLGGNGTQSLIGLGTGGTIAIVGVTIAMSSVGVLLLVLGLIVTGLLAILGVFITLTIRQAIITALVFLAPVAFALWCLPNTEKWFKKWWDTLFQMLLAYPLILGLFAVANVMAAIVGQDQSTLNAIISFALVLIPLFMVPAMLRMSGSMLGQIQGAVSGMMKRANSFTGRKLIGAGGKEIASRAHEASQGNFFKGGNERNRRGKFNKAFHYAATAGNLRNLNGPPSRWGGAIRSAMSTQSLEDIGKMREDVDYKQWMNDDTINRAAAESHDAASFQARLRALDTKNGTEDGRYFKQDGSVRDSSALSDITSHVDRVRRKYDAETFKRTATLQAISGGTAYNSGEFATALAAAAGNDDAMLGTLVGEAKGLAMKAGRIEQGGSSYGAILGAARDVRNKARDGVLTQTDIDAAGASIEDSAADSSSPGQAIYGKPQSAEAIANAHARKIDRALRHAKEVEDGISAGTHTQDDLIVAEREAKQAMASAAGVYDAMSQASPQNARAFANGLTGNGLMLTNLPSSLRASMALRPDGASSAATNVSMLEGLENLRAHDKQFAEMRRDYGSQAAAEAAHAAGITGTPPMPGGPAPGAAPGGSPAPPF